MVICGFITLFTLCPFETKNESNFYFGIDYIFLHRLYVFVPKWSKGEFVGFIGYILIQKKHCHIRTLLEQGHRNSEELSDIADYILQHGKGLIWQDMHQISRERQFPKTRKVLTRVQLSKGSLHCDRLDGQRKRLDALQCYIMSK
jgi:hypothetical protein